MKKKPMKHVSLVKQVSLGVALLVGAVGLSQLAVAQPPGPPRPVPQGQAGARFDLTGYWTAVVTEDWRWRMMTAPKGDFASVPLNDAGKKVGNEWTQEQDGSCKAYGVGNLMRMPTRLHITWASDQALKIESDWGEQTRTLYFRAADVPADAAGSPQGVSLARWEPPVPLGGVQGYRPPATGGDLRVVTDHQAAGWLRRNGVPYSADAQITEYFQTFSDPLGREWFDVTTEVDDPTYLVRSFITSSDFRKEPDGSQWAPHPCKSI